jgi:hypothetical protein
MHSQETVDILVMRGAGRVQRYRVRSFWLRALWLTPLVLVLLLAASLAVIKQQRDTQVAQTERTQAMRAELDTVGERLVRLENIEKILRSKDMTELETLLASVNPDSPDWWKPTVQRKDGPETKERESAKPDLAKLLARVDANQAGVDNLRAKIENRKLQINFDLSNLSPQSNLSGRGEIALVGNDATISPLKPDKDDLTFQIQRFKQIAANLALPVKCDPKEVYGFKLTILDPSGKTIFSQVYPLGKD